MILTDIIKSLSFCKIQNISDIYINHLKNCLSTLNVYGNNIDYKQECLCNPAEGYISWGIDSHH